MVLCSRGKRKATQITDRNEKQVVIPKYNCDKVSKRHPKYNYITWSEKTAPEIAPISAPTPANARLIKCPGSSTEPGLAEGVVAHLSRDRTSLGEMNSMMQGGFFKTALSNQVHPLILSIP